jgi:uncharacterized RDD family membrane protein YckC
VSQAPDAADERAAYAGFWRRFAAYAIDYVLVLLGGIVLGALVIRAGIVEDGTQGLFTLWLLVGYFLYCTLLESSAWQATAGKRFIGIKVVNRHGERISFARAAARFVAKVLSVLTLFVGYFLIVVTTRRQALHDLIAGTLVTHDGTRRRPSWLVAAISALASVPFVGVLVAIVLSAYEDLGAR